MTSTDFPFIIVETKVDRQIASRATKGALWFTVLTSFGAAFGPIGAVAGALFSVGLVTLPKILDTDAAKAIRAQDREGRITLLAMTGGSIPGKFCRPLPPPMFAPVNVLAAASIALASSWCFSGVIHRATEAVANIGYLAPDAGLLSRASQILSFSFDKNFDPQTEALRVANKEVLARIKKGEPSPRASVEYWIQPDSKSWSGKTNILTSGASAECVTSPLPNNSCFNDSVRPARVATPVGVSADNSTIGSANPS